MAGIPAGTFVMGSPRQEPGRFQSEGPQHAVSVQAFALGKYMVTSGEFLTFLRDTGYQPKACNPMLGLGWRVPQNGLAYPPFIDEPRRWTGGDCTEHVLRGGSWDNLPLFVRAAARGAGGSDGGEYDYSSLAGFRVARDLP